MYFNLLIRLIVKKLETLKYYLLRVNVPLACFIYKALHFNLDRSHCDLKFRRDMQRICAKTNKTFIGRIACLTVSDTYFTAVQTAGSLYFVRPSKNYCKQSWVRDCVF